MKKIIAPIIVTVLFIAYFIIYFALIINAIPFLWLNIVLLIKR